MNIVDFEKDPVQKLSKISSVLQNRFGLKLDFSNPRALLETFRYCEEFKLNYKKNNNLSESEKSLDYTKAFLLSEAIRIVLREIAPKRTMKSRRAK
jgi:hypothetical protein